MIFCPMSHIRSLTASPALSVINTQKTSQCFNLFKNISLAVLFGSNGNSYTICTQSDMCVCTHILHKIWTLVGQRNEKKKIGTPVKAEGRGNFSANVCSPALHQGNIHFRKSIFLGRNCTLA